MLKLQSVIKKLMLCVGMTLVISTQTQAQVNTTQTWVSGGGDDTNSCSRTAPCKTFAGAISKTAPGGEINCLDAGGFGTVTIGQSITILCPDGLPGGVLTSGVDGITINGAGINVTLKGLDIENVGGVTNSGINIIDAANVTIDKTVIHNFLSGVKVDTGSPIRVSIKDSLIIGPDGAKGVEERSTAGAQVIVEVNNSFINSSSTPVSTFIGVSSFASNAGSSSVARLYGSRINGLITDGVSPNKGRILSYGNNFLSNIASGTTIESVPMQLLKSKRDYVQHY